MTTAKYPHDKQERNTQSHNEEIDRIKFDVRASRINPGEYVFKMNKDFHETSPGICLGL
jgi:hypothetical protein